MVFTSFTFIVFMLIVFILFYTIPKNKQWWLLLVASYVFYGFASPLYIVFLMITTIISYTGAVCIENNYVQEKSILSSCDVMEKKDMIFLNHKMENKRKCFLSITIILLLLMLVVLKYSLFLFDNFSALISIFGIDIPSPSLNIVLPVGLSFYLFQSIGYCIDVYRGSTCAERNYFKYSLFISYFPQIMQGPIGEYNSLAPQLFKEHVFSYKSTVNALQRISWGFFKKLVIANQIFLLSDNLFDNAKEYKGFFIWAFAICMYAVQLYADFSGYMDIAIGCSNMLGIRIEENFNTPYFSKSIPEYWRRWHITLGKWFRNYVYYPVLRSPMCVKISKKYRKKNPYLSRIIPTIFGLLTVWLLIGFWHGADWSYVVHGLFHGTFIILAVVMTPIYNKIHNKIPVLNKSSVFSAFRVLRTFFIVCIGYSIFRPANLEVTITIFRNMFLSMGTSELHDLLLLDSRITIIVGISIFVLFVVDLYHYKTGKSIRKKISGFNVAFRWIIYLLVLLAIIFWGAYSDSSLNQFAYFRF